jgi:hypothetical protein
MAAAELPQPTKIRHFARSAHSGDFETLERNILIAMFLFDDSLIGFLSRMVADAALLVSTAKSVYHMLLLCIFLHAYHCKGVLSLLPLCRVMSAPRHWAIRSFNKTSLQRGMMLPGGFAYEGHETMEGCGLSVPAEPIVQPFFG